MAPKRKRSGDRPEPADLADMRQHIDELDASIQEMINERARCAQRVGRAKGKGENTVDYYRPEREAQVLRGVVERNTGPLSDEEMVRLFREIMSACLAQQEPLKIAYLGPEGTFTQAAVLKHFGHSVRALSLATVEEVFAEVESQVADFGIVPLENSMDGSVYNTLDVFLRSPLKICGEVELRVQQHLLSRQGELGRIHRVYAHRHSLAQCRASLEQALPGAQVTAVGSNAEAARRARDEKGAAAIAGDAAAEVYGLGILLRNIEDKPDDTTRFLVIGRELFSPSGEDKTSLLISVTHEPGALQRLLDPLARHDISMTRIESRPFKHGKGDYVFFVDVEGHADDSHLASALADLRKTSLLFKILGSYPRAVL